jgi:hypothetical protein
MIQAYFFDKSNFTEDDVKNFIINNNIKRIKISDNKYHYKIKMLSAKKLREQGFNLTIQKEKDYKICKASKPEINNICKFTFN